MGEYDPHQPGSFSFPAQNTVLRPLPPLPPAHILAASPSTGTHALPSPALQLHEQPQQPGKRPRGRPLKRPALDDRTYSGTGGQSRSNSHDQGYSAVSTPATSGTQQGDHDQLSESDHQGTSSKQRPPNKKVKVGARAQIACLTCRRRKVRCPSEWPVCSFCSARDMKCEYDCPHPAENEDQNGGSGSHLPELIMPPTQVLFDALDAFYAHLYEMGYFLHRASFTDSIRKGTYPRELMCCILALTAKFSSSVSELHHQKGYSTLAPSVASYYSSHASSLLSDPKSNITLARCQALLLLGLYDCTDGSENSGWMRIGSAIRAAQILRLGFVDENRSAENERKRGDKEATLIEEKRRTFWCCFLVERLLTDGKDRPYILTAPPNWCIDLPSMDTDYHESRKPQRRGVRFDPQTPPWLGPPQPPQPPQPTASTSSTNTTLDTFVPPEADLYGQVLRVSDIWARVVTYIGLGGRNYDRRPAWVPESSFAVLVASLDQFKSQLHEHLRYNESNLVAHSMIGQGRMYALLHLIIFTSTLYLHRDHLPFLPPIGFDIGKGLCDGEPVYGGPPMPPNWYPESVAKGYRACADIVQLSKRMAEHGNAISNPFGGLAVLGAANILIQQKYWPQSPPNGYDLESSIKGANDILLDYKAMYPVLGSSLYDGFSRLYILYANASRGVLEGDPSRVRGLVIKLLRTNREEEDVSPSRSAAAQTDGGGSVNGAGAAAAQLVAQGQGQGSTLPSALKMEYEMPVGGGAGQPGMHMLSQQDQQQSHLQQQQQQLMIPTSGLDEMGLTTAWADPFLDLDIPTYIPLDDFRADENLFDFSSMFSWNNWSDFTLLQ